MWKVKDSRWLAYQMGGMFADHKFNSSKGGEESRILGVLWESGIIRWPCRRLGLDSMECHHRSDMFPRASSLDNSTDSTECKDNVVDRSGLRH